MSLASLMDQQTNYFDEVNYPRESRPAAAVPTWVRARPGRSILPGRPVLALSAEVEEVLLTRLDQPRRVPVLMQFEELTALQSELSALVAKIEATLKPSLPGPIQFVARLAERWDVSNDQIAVLLGLDTPEMASDVLRGVIRLRGRDAEDRVANLFRIFEALFGLLRDSDEEKRWLRQPRDHFNGLTCLDVMLKGGIENLVDVRRWIEHLAGR